MSRGETALASEPDQKLFESELVQVGARVHLNRSLAARRSSGLRPSAGWELRARLGRARI